MDKKLKDFDTIKSIKCGGHVYFNMRKGDGALCYECNGLYVLFQVTMYGITEYYEGTYFDDQIDEMLEKVYSWSY